MVLEMIGLLCDGDTHLFVDPAFGDHGRLYSLLDRGLPAQMRRLCARARTITPNLTEAAFLLDEPYPGDAPREAQVARLCRGLRDLGPENVVVTDVAARPGLTGAAVLARGHGRAAVSLPRALRGPVSRHGGRAGLAPAGRADAGEGASGRGGPRAGSDA